MERVLGIPGLSNLILKEFSINQLATLRVSRGLRSAVSLHAGERMESYGRALRRRCTRIMSETTPPSDTRLDPEGSWVRTDNGWVNTDNPVNTILHSPNGGNYTYVYNYYHTIVKLSFLSPEKQKYLDTLIAYLKENVRGVTMDTCVKKNGYYRTGKSFGHTTGNFTLYDILGYLYLISCRSVHESEVKHLENKLLPVTIG